METEVDSFTQRQHPWHILLCDDSPVERLALGHFLRRTGYHVDEAADGQSGILHLQHRPVDLMVLDLQMPGADGFHVLNYLHEHRPGLPVILMSGMPLDQIQHKMQGLKKQELPPLLLKPIDLNELLKLMELLLSGEFSAENEMPRIEQ